MIGVPSLLFVRVAVRSSPAPVVNVSLRPLVSTGRAITVKVIPALYSLDNILGIKIRSKELLWNNKFKDNGEIIEIGYSTIKIKYDSVAVIEYPNNKPLGEEFRIVY